jgi:hypothetical protein
MADSDAVRSARKRHHARGDHSLCRPGRCRDAPDGPPPPLVIAAGALDAGAELEALAKRLRAASEADPLNMGVARELRETLRALPPPLGPLDPLEARQVEVASRRLLASVSPIRGGDGRG